MEKYTTDFVVAYETGNANYNVKNLYQYVVWQSLNPRKAEIGGHGADDPSGIAAFNEQGIFDNKKAENKKATKK